jgi:SPP1 gp7 family putative phage head morphogenesis protein
MKAVKVMQNKFEKQLKKNRKYWKKRFEILEESAIKKGADYYESLDKQYRIAEKRIESQISTWYQRFAYNNNISLTEARRLLNSSELEEFKWSVEEYIKHGQQNAFTQEWMKELENASAKVHISRLESLKLQMQQELEVLYGNQLDGVDKLARDIYSDNYYHTAFEIQKGFNVGWNLHSLDNRLLDKVIAKPWTADGKTFSDKLWTQKNDLITTLHTEITQAIMRGDAPDRAIDTIARKFKVAKSKAGRLVMTESAYFASASQKDCFKELDVERFEIVATLDSHTSELCQSMDGVVQDMKDFEPGVTAPPFHPWCRTTTVPYFDDDFGERAARDADGKTYYVPSNMTYKEWKNGFVDGHTENLTKIEPDDIIEVKNQDDGHKVVDGKEIFDTWQRRPDEYDFEIEDVINAQGFDGLPTVLDDEDFEKAVKESNFIAQRTYSAPSQEVVDAYQDELYHSKWYVDCSKGGAQYGQGMYCAADYNGKLTDGIKAEMSHYQSLSKQKFGFEAFKEKLNTVKLSDFDMKYKMSDEEFAVMKKYMSSSNIMRSEYMLSEDDRKIFRNIKPKAKDEAKRLLSKIESDCLLNTPSYSHTETFTLHKSAKIFTLKHSEDTVDIVNRLGDEFVKNRLKTPEAHDLFEEMNQLVLNRQHIDFDDYYDMSAKLRDEKVWKDEIQPLYNEWFAKTTKMNEGSVAAMMGYDAINAEGHGKSGSYTVILNRTKVIFKKGG